MDVSKRQASGGPELIDQVVTLTGLPDTLVQTELEQILGQAGCNKESLTLDELRTAMLAYLESMQAELEAQSESAPEDREPILSAVPKE
jgi:hypothetical protein